MFARRAMPLALPLLLLLGAFADPFVGAAAAQEGGEPVPGLVELTTASVKPSKGGWELSFVGTGAKLPKGAVLKWSLQWRMQSLREFTTTLGGNKKIRETIPFEDLQGYAADIFLRLEIDYLAQPREVKEAMDKDPETFLMEQNPWTIRFWDQRFSLGTEAQMEKQKEEARKFFLDTLKGALAAEKKFSQKSTAAESGSDFQKGGAFDSKAWQRFVEKDVRDPLRALQKSLRDKGGHLMLLTESRDLGYLTEIVNAIALRSYERSRTLYEKLGIIPDSADFSPKEIDVNCSSSKSSYLQKRTQQLCRSQKIDMNELR
jgi:hypothetical protein